MPGLLHQFSFRALLSIRYNLMNCTIYIYLLTASNIKHSYLWLLPSPTNNNQSLLTTHTLTYTHVHTKINKWHHQTRFYSGGKMWFDFSIEVIYQCNCIPICVYWHLHKVNRSALVGNQYTQLDYPVHNFIVYISTTQLFIISIFYPFLFLTLLPFTFMVSVSF